MVKVSGKRRRVFYLSLAILFLLLGIIFASRGRYVSYGSSSPRLKFTFLYPRGWKVIELEGKKDGYGQVRILRPKNRKKSIYKHTLAITISPVKEEEGKHSSLEEKISDYEERKQRLFRNFKFLSEKEIILGGQKAKEIMASFQFPAVGSLPAKELSFKSQRVFLRRGSYFYELGYETNERNFSRYSKTFSKLCKSFAFKESLPGEIEARDIKMEEEETYLAKARAAGEEEKMQEEEQEPLDVAKAVNPSSVNYTETVNPEKLVDAGGKTLPGQEVKEEETVEEPEKRGMETLVIVNFKEADISEVIYYLSRMSGVAIALDEKALKELKNRRVSLYTPVAIPLTDALDLVLKVKGLNYIIKENYIRVTRRGQEEDEESVTRTYKLKYGIRKLQPVELTLEKE